MTTPTTTPTTTNPPTAQQLGQRLEQDPIQAVRLAVAVLLVAGFNANPSPSGTGDVSAVDAALEQADELIGRTIGG